MIEISATAMILAAGFGKRLGDMTKNTPKPLVAIGDTCCLDLSVNALKNTGFKRIIINTHYLAGQIEEHAKRHYKDIEIILSYETTLLETAGGIRKVLDEFNSKPFVVVNADMYWQDTNPSVIHQMIETMHETDDFCLCVTPLENAKGHLGGGDFVLEGEFLRNLTEGNLKEKRYVYIGVQLVQPKVIEPLNIEPLGLLSLYKRALQKKTLRGVIFEGTWIDVGNIEGLNFARSLVSQY